MKTKNDLKFVERMLLLDMIMSELTTIAFTIILITGIEITDGIIAVGFALLLGAIIVHQLTKSAQELLFNKH